jgi:hypothetical protein
VLDDALRIWQGPPPADLARYPVMLGDLAALADADTVVIDSLKDAALKLSDDESGSGWNRARQRGAELIELHHPRKAQARQPQAVQAGGPVRVTVDHRQRRVGDLPMGRTWGPGSRVHPPESPSQAGLWMMRLNPGAGTVHLDRPAIDRVEHIRYRPNGITAEGAARLLSGGESPTRSEIEKARYRLNQKVAAGVLYRRDGIAGPITLVRASAAGRHAALTM